MKKSLARILTSNLFVSLVLILAQFILFIGIITALSTSQRSVYYVLYILTTLIVLWIVRKKDNPAYKMTWLIIVLIFPVVGGVVYLFMGNTPFNRARLVKVKPIMRPKVQNIQNVFDDLTYNQRKYMRNINYLENISNMPAWAGTATEYYPSGEEFFSSILIQLEKAQKFIFMEYFIIDEGFMWSEILKILEKKAKDGIDIRIMYDDIGCFATLPRGYREYLISLGIKCVAFNKARPTLSTYINYRNHRKICIIDGEVGFMGGINLADEYINRIERFGHWKDTAIKLTGDAITSLTAMFLELWNFSSNDNTNLSDFKSNKIIKGDGLVQPFADSPLDNNRISANVYMNILNTAKRYVYITTPYLLLDNEMITALCSAALSGIDVRIVTPHIPDKWYIHVQTRSFYFDLIEAGVKIYEYHPGFMHSKTLVSDDDVAIVGTVNLDFRSLYMHFECATVFYGGEVVYSVLDDMKDNFEKSRRIKKRELSEMSPLYSFFVSLLRVFAPLM